MSIENNVGKKAKDIKPFDALEKTSESPKVDKEEKDFSLSNIQNLSFEDLRLKIINITGQRSDSFDVIKRKIEKIVDQNIVNFIRSYFCDKNQLSEDNSDITGNYMEDEVLYIKTPAFYARIPVAFFNEIKSDNYNHDYTFKNIPTRSVNVGSPFDSKMSIGEVEYALKVMMLKVIKNDAEKNDAMLELKGAD